MRIRGEKRPCRSCREKDDKIKELEEQVKALKDCDNCFHKPESRNWDWKKASSPECDICRSYDKWESI